MFNVVIWFLSGFGTVGAQGGAGAPVPHCNKVTTGQKCEECKDSYYWVEFNCVADCQDPENRRPGNYHEVTVGRSCHGEKNILPIVSGINCSFNIDLGFFLNPPPSEDIK